jgi:hypothetical protein
MTRAMRHLRARDSAGFRAAAGLLRDIHSTNASPMPRPHYTMTLAHRSPPALHAPTAHFGATLTCARRSKSRCCRRLRVMVAARLRVSVVQWGLEYGPLVAGASECRPRVRRRAAREDPQELRRRSGSSRRVAVAVDVEYDALHARWWWLRVLWRVRCAVVPPPCSEICRHCLAGACSQASQAALVFAQSLDVYH